MVQTGQITHIAAIGWLGISGIDNYKINYIIACLVYTHTNYTRLVPKLVHYVRVDVIWALFVDIHSWFAISAYYILFSL